MWAEKAVRVCDKRPRGPCTCLSQTPEKRLKKNANFNTEKVLLLWKQTEISRISTICSAVAHSRVFIVKTFVCIN